MTIFFNYATSQCLSSPVLIGNLELAPNGSVDTTPNPTKYRVGQITQSGTTVTGSGTTFTSADIGSTLIWQDGTQATISAVGSATSITVSNTQTVSISQNFTVSTGTSYNISSALELKSRTGALVVTRMTTAQRTGLNSVNSQTQIISNGMLVYDITVGALFSYQAGAWVQLVGTSSAGQLLLPSGTAAAPSYSFTADPTTGMWLAQAGHLDFSANGINAFEVTTQGAAVNQLQVVANATGVSPDLVANGTNGVADANMNIGLVAQGTGSVSIYGTENHTGGVSSAGSLQFWNAADSQSVTISSYQLDSSFNEFYFVKQLTQAQLTTAYDTPILLIAGFVGSSIIVTQCELYMHFATSGLTGAGTGIIQYSSTNHGGGTNALGAAITNAFMTTTASASQSVVPLNAATTLATTTTNTGIYFSNTTADYAGGDVTNTKLTIYLKVAVIPTV